MASKNTKFLGLEIGSRLTVNPELRSMPETNCGSRPRTTDSSGRRDRIHEVGGRSVGGTLSGHGIVKADLLQRHLALNLDKPMVVDGAVKLSGKLNFADSVKVKHAKNATVLKAKSISGRFANRKVSLAGKSYSISYTPTSVTVTAN